MKKIILKLLPWFIALLAIAALVVFVGIPLYSETDEVHTDAPTVVSYEGGKEPLIMENDNLLFEMDPATTQFKVTEKASGRVWLSNPENAANDPIAISSNKEMMQSTATVTYTTAGGTTELNNFKFSIENGNYEIVPMDDGSLCVNYAIGKIEKTYLIPKAITEERYDAFYEGMKKSTKKKINSNYSLYGPDNIDSKKNKDEIIALYPEVLNQNLYILKADTSENNMKKIEEYFQEVNYSQEDYEIDQQLIAGTKESDNPVFNVQFIYRLEENDLVVEVPYSEIKYKPDYPITYLTLLPMFGAAGVEEDGFMFIPEGGGALINYNNGKLAQNSYYANVYGWDYATVRSELVNETRNTFPVFGMTGQGGSFICIIEGSPSYAGLMADISMRYNAYNWMCAKYNVLHFDQYNVSARTAQLVYMYEKEIPDNDSIIQRYRFIDSDNYVAMATAYGEYLREKEPLLKDAVASEDVPVSVEMVGAIDKTVVKFGLPIDSVYPTTSFLQAQDILNQFVDGGVRNLNVQLSGWCNGGITQKVFNKIRVLKELGGTKDLKALMNTAAEKNVPLYLDGITCFAYDSGLFQGFIPFNNAARYTTREQVHIYPYDVITYLEADWLDPYYLVKPEYAKQNATTLINGLKELGASGVSFRDIGYLLSADYNPRNVVTREQVKAMNIQTMQEARDAGQNVMIRMGNDYAIPYADLITDMDLWGTKYSIIDQQVPFYQIALHGMKDYTGAPINLASDYRRELLKCAEYGSGLNFTFMAEDTKLLQDTTHSGYFAAYYLPWADEVLEMAKQYQDDMAGLNQLAIVDHVQLSDEVTVTTYADGTQVYVNYDDVGHSYDGVYIAAQDYAVKRGDSK
ncbi:MAG: hypothetical protein E7319_00370 [Clostridiales bacterium]|nr:hypothetical protein [Clostridiales bacterium]